MDRILKKVKNFILHNEFRIRSIFIFIVILLSVIPVASLSLYGVTFSGNTLSFGNGEVLNFGDDVYGISDDFEYNGVELFGNSQISEENIPEGSYKVLRTTLKSADWMDSFGSVTVNNEGKKQFSIEELLSEKSEIVIDKSKKYQVLIVHSHATESYNDYGVDYYNGKMSFRSDDNNKNMIHIGNILTAMLEEAGFGVIHDKTQHDNPDYNNAYKSSRAVITDYLKQYPEIEIVLDIHRDTVITSSKTKYRTVTEIDGETVAQVMLLMGSGKTDQPNPHWTENLKFALMLQKTAAEAYPGLMRPILLRNYQYNQDITSGSLLLEVGTCGNSSEEAEKAIKYLGECLIKTLNAIENGEVLS